MADNWTRLLEALLLIVTAFLGGQGIIEALKGINNRVGAKRNARNKIIQDATLLIQKLDSTAYPLMGDFTKDMRFLAISKYLSTELSNEIFELVICQNLPHDAGLSLRESQATRYERIIIGLKKEVVELESRWISNPGRK